MNNTLLLIGAVGGYLAYRRGKDRQVKLAECCTYYDNAILKMQPSKFNIQPLSAAMPPQPMPVQKRTLLGPTMQQITLAPELCNDNILTVLKLGLMSESAWRDKFRPLNC